MRRIVRSFSLDPERDQDILDHLAEIRNQSAYIRLLIKVDMQGTGWKDSDAKTFLQKMVEEVITEMGVSITASKSSSPSLQNQDLEGIKAILKMGT